MKPIRIYQCNENPDCILTAIYEAYASRYGHKNIKIAIENANETLLLFAKYYTVTADYEKSFKVKQTIQKKISEKAYELIYHALLSYSPSKADAVYRFVIYGLSMGETVTDALGIPEIQKVWKLSQFTAHETHQYTGFLRFEELKGKILLARFRPKNNILTLLAPHFAERFPEENFLIIDEGRNLAAVHVKSQRYFIISLTDKQKEDLVKNRIKEDIEELWTTFYQNISIKERENKNLNASNLPLRYREFM